MDELKLRLQSEDFGTCVQKFEDVAKIWGNLKKVWLNSKFFSGKHLMGVEDLLQKHSLVEADINVLGERVKGVVQQSQRFLDPEATEGYRPLDPALVMEKIVQLEVKIRLNFLVGDVHI